MEPEGRLREAPHGSIKKKLKHLNQFTLGLSSEQLRFMGNVVLSEGKNEAHLLQT